MHPFAQFVAIASGLLSLLATVLMLCKVYEGFEEKAVKQFALLAIFFLSLSWTAYWLGS